MKALLPSAAILVFLSVGCGNDSGGPAGNGGSPGNGGARSGGAANGGGTNASGGATANGGAPASGGITTGNGGATASGGASSSSGGATASGGKASGGASNGGATASGGSTSGGRQGTGGSNGGQPSAGAGGQGTAGMSSSGGAAAGGGSSTQSAGCGKAPTIMSSQYNNGTTIPITVGGVQRRYVLNVPTNYDMTKPYKLVVTLHARDGNDKRMYNWQYYGLLPLANNTAIFVAPNGSQTNGSPCTGTADGEGSCGWPNSGGKDLALIDAVVAEMEKNFCIDTTRIFATGWSYGGSMSYAVGCARPLGGTDAPWGVRAIALYSAAQLSGSCTPAAPVAFYASHGTHDSVLNYDSMGLPLAQNFAKANGCTWATPTKVTSGQHVCTNMTGCKMGYPLEFCSFNGDHTPFPDTGSSSGSWGPQEAWKFLNQF